MQIVPGYVIHLAHKSLGCGFKVYIYIKNILIAKCPISIDLLRGAH